MDSGVGGSNGQPSQVLSREALAFLGEGINLVFSRWTALQIAVENGWGGRESRKNWEDLANSVREFFTLSKGPLYVDDLENLLDESMIHFFNVDVVDGSVEEVAEQLMIMHEDCLKGNYESIEKLRRSGPRIDAVSQSKRVIRDDEDESSDSDKEKADMMVDEPKLNVMAVDQPKSQNVPDEEGWSLVAPRRNRGKKRVGVNLPARSLADDM